MLPASYGLSVDWSRMIPTVVCYSFLVLQLSATTSLCFSCLLQLPCTTVVCYNVLVLQSPAATSLHYSRLLQLLVLQLSATTYLYYSCLLQLPCTTVACYKFLILQSSATTSLYYSRLLQRPCTSFTTQYSPLSRYSTISSLRYTTGKDRKL